MTSAREPDFRALFQASPSPYLVMTADFVIVAVNRAYAEATFINPDAVVGRPMFEVFPDNPDDPLADGVVNLRRSLETVVRTRLPDALALQRYDVRAPDGTFVERYWSPVNTPVLDDDGRVTVIIHRVQDVTDLVRLSEAGQERQRREDALWTRLEQMEADLFTRAREVQDANQRLRELNAQLEMTTAALRAQTRAKDRFLATLSHELRNPLAAVRAALDVLALDLAGHPALEVLDRQSAALTRMSDDLLDAARGLTGRLAVQRRRIDLRAVVERVVHDTRSTGGSAGRHVELHLPSTPVSTHGDPVRLAQTIANLLDNACKHTPAGAAISVELDHRGDVAELRVRDTGPGLPPGLAGSLFEPFTRAADPGRGGPEGLGLGLAVVRSIVAAHGGTVTAHNDPAAGGATFTVRLPVITGPDEGADDGPATATTAPMAPTAPLRILVIDDNEDLARSYGSLLQELGHEVTLASSGEHGLTAAQEPFDVVLCDIALGAGIDGYEVARRLRCSPTHRSTRLVAVSGFGRDEDRARAREAGFDRHLTKPLGMDDLDSLLRSLTAGLADGLPERGIG
jgi:PAS domain S-box-containing protein